jgi:hypothetical protein
MTLRDLQSAANRQHVQQPLTWQALNNALKPYGNPEIDDYSFSKRWDDPKDGPILKQLVDRFDRNNIVLKTNAKEPGKQGSSGPDAMAKMAKRATDKAFK